MSISDIVYFWRAASIRSTVTLSESSLGRQFGKELVIVETAIHVSVVALNQRAEVFVRHVEAVPREELTQVIFVDVTVIAHIDQIEGLASGELWFPLGQDS